MPAHTHAAAQYIRMSTDKQDLSPGIQKEAITAYAAATGLEIIASYEDEGRSGVYLKNRPGLTQLLKDVTNGAQFSSVLVYDVSRWGRFQEADASAYYDYHCRLHGVQVVYVAEAFGSEVTPMSALIKNMKRVMAAEYSRELATKCRAGQHRVVNLGYQMGQLPALGYRRCSVSADSKRRVVLVPGQRKLAFTDRVEWILGPDAEIAMIRRLCEQYARGKLHFIDMAKLATSEGWRDQQGRRLTQRSIATLLRNEALIGNFVWGRHCHEQRILDSALCRATGTVPRIIDDQTWDLIQSRLARDAVVKSDDVLLDELRQAFVRRPLLGTRDLPAEGCEPSRIYRYRFGTWSNAVRQAGSDPSSLASAVLARGRARIKHIRDFGIALAKALRSEGLPAAFDGRCNALSLWGVTLQLRLLWQTQGDADHQWHLREGAAKGSSSHTLVVRMRQPFVAQDYFVVPSHELATRFPPWLPLQVVQELQPLWCRSPAALIARLRELTAAR